ncbi:type II secretion system F family protein [Escherichia albertii]|uniref:type II secretion system F family protein n=1 Tax=Escherichia albertii TaxID=208962 RepID=UPI000CF6A25E|nr:type II secretion system F family protein [Escherichia albertii]EFB5188745.1 hypothetical protein [Escherichia albertii]
MIYFYLLLICFSVLLLFYATKSKPINIDIKKIEDKKERFSFSKNRRNILISFFESFFSTLYRGGRKNFLRNIIIIISVNIIAFLANKELFHISDFFYVALVSSFSTLFILYKREIKKRKDEFDIDFTEALNIILTSVKSGHSIISAFGECGRNLNGALGKEFVWMLKRIDFGDAPERVFDESFLRFKYRNYYLLLTAVLVNLKGGGQISEIVSKLSELVSETRIIERKKIALTSEIRMSVKVLVAIPVLFILFLKYVSPENFNVLIYEQAGRYILYYAVVSILTGLGIIWGMMNKEL